MDKGIKGSCPHGDSCHYANGEHELRVHSKYKTSPCHSYWQTRECTLGSACNFYHSESERRKPGAGYRETSDKIENISQNINSTKRNGVKEDRLVLEELETSKDIEEMSGAASRAGSTLRSRRG